MKKAGIILIILQALGILGSLMQDVARHQTVGSGFMNMLQGGVSGIIQLIGFFLIGIIGVCLLIAANKKGKK